MAQRGGLGHDMPLAGKKIIVGKGHAHVGNSYFVDGTRATRNPTCSDALGGSGIQISEPQFLPLSYQLPPRCRPGVAVNSPTLPCMSYIPQALGRNEPTSIAFPRLGPFGAPLWGQSPLKFACVLSSLSPNAVAVVVPARHAYSHCLSVGSRPGVDSEIGSRLFFSPLRKEAPTKLGFTGQIAHDCGGPRPRCESGPSPTRRRGRRRGSSSRPPAA